MTEVLRPPAVARRHVRFARYTGGSVIALATSEVVFSLSYGSGALGTTAASVVAFFAGAVPNYIANRRWAWGRRGRPDVRREVIAYAAVSLVSLVAAAWATGYAKGEAPHFTADHDVRVAIVAAAYLATYGVLFIAKFLLFDHWIFASRRGPATTS